MIENRFITLACLFGATASFIMSLLFGSPLMAAISALMFAITFMVWKYGYLFIPVLTRAANVVEVRGNYIINQGRDAILKSTGVGWYCTKVLEIIFFESAEGKSKEEKKLLFEMFEKAIASFKYPVKLSILIAPQDISEYVDTIKTKRSELEAKLGHCVDEAEQRNIERRIATLNNLLDRIISGEKPMDVLAYVATTAFGTTREEAEIMAKRQAKEVSTIIASTLNAEVRELKDLDLIKAFEFEYFVPETREALVDEVF
jgi:hypothetical protein